MLKIGGHSYRTMIMKVGIVIPAYNEETRIVKTLDDFSKTIFNRYGKGLFLIIVSDNSTDRTNSIIEKYSKRYSQIRCVISTEKLGKGGSIIKGFGVLCKKYKPQVIGFVDADSLLPGRQIIDLLEFMRDSKVDGVIASRYLKDSKITGNQGMARFLASRGYNIMVRLLFGMDIKDTQCGAKFFKAGAICSSLRDIKLTDMSFDVNLLYELHRRNFRVVEVPLSYSVVKEGSKVDLKKQIPKMFLMTAGYRLVRSPLNIVIPERLKMAVYNCIRNW